MVCRPQSPSPGQQFCTHSLGHATSQDHYHGCADPMLCMVPRPMLEGGHHRWLCVESCHIVFHIATSSSLLRHLVTVLLHLPLACPRLGANSLLPFDVCVGMRLRLAQACCLSAIGIHCNTAGHMTLLYCQTGRYCSTNTVAGYLIAACSVELCCFLLYA